MQPPIRIWLAAVCCLGLCASVAYAGTSASEHNVRVTSGAPLALGISSGDSVGLLDSGTQNTRKAWTAKAKAIGVQITRVGVDWAAIAPKSRPPGFDASNPSSSGYSWSALDAEVRLLSSEGFRILMTVNDAPSWAEGADRPKSAFAGSWKPSDSDFQKFAHAIATRYDGDFPDPLNVGKNLPRVTDWQGWNEPNMSQFLAPQWKNDQSGTRECSSAKTYLNWNGKTAEGPTLYRGLANAFYAGVKSVSSSDYVVLAGVAPYGNPNCIPLTKTSIDYRIPPVAFDQDLFCLTAADNHRRGCNSKVHFDALDSHPYSPPYTGATDGPNWSAYYPNDIAIPDVGRLTKTVRAAVKIGTALPKANKGLWVTEVAWDTSPKDPYGVPANKEAHWEEQALYMLWKQGVHTILWWALGDTKSFSFSRNPWPSQSGEYYSDGKAKPSATAFSFPFVTTRQTKSRIQAWGRAPAAGTVTIQRQSGKSWKAVARFHADARQVFEVSLAESKRMTFRAVVGSRRSLSWTQAG